MVVVAATAAAAVGDWDWLEAAAVVDVVVCFVQHHRAVADAVTDTVVVVVVVGMIG